MKGKEVVTKKTFNEQKEWQLSTKKEQGKKEEAVINEPCEKCDSKLCYYYGRQMRSVDEGQTIFYTCVKCGHKFSNHT